MKTTATPNKKSFGYMFGSIEAWVQKQKEAGADVADIPEKLGSVWELAKKQRARIAEYEQQELDKKLTEIIDAPAHSSHAAVYIELDGSGESNNCFVHVEHEDGSEHSPARAFRCGNDICMEMWPLPHQYTFTLHELRALVKALDAAEHNLLFDTPAEDGLGA